MLLAVGWNSRSQSQMDSLSGYGVTVPSEGTVAVPILIARVVGRSNGKAAQAFINFSLGAQVQQAFAEAMYYAPSNQKAKIGEAARARIPLLSPGVAARLIPLDWADAGPAVPYAGGVADAHHEAGAVGLIRLSLFRTITTGIV